MSVNNGLPLRVLCITRCYPPIIGGMEKVSHELTSHLSELVDLKLIANRKGKKNLPFFLIYAFFRAWHLIKTASIDIIHLSDALLAPLGLILKLTGKLPVVCTVHGLDVIYPHKLYQRIIRFSLQRLDKVICISQQTQTECLNRGLAVSKCQIIPNGINPEEFYLESDNPRKELAAKLKIDLTDKRLLLSVGHLVKRKGFLWFIREVMPKLDRNTIYLIIGSYGNASSGDEKERYLSQIEALGLEQQVFLLGKVPAEILKLAYNSADLLVMPNIKVPGDMEGFGIVAIEASSCGLPVLASDLEGIKDAVCNHKNGWRIQPEKAEAFAEKILDFRPKESFRQQVRQFTIQHYHWNRIVNQYQQLLIQTVSQTKR